MGILRRIKGLFSKPKAPEMRIVINHDSSADPKTLADEIAWEIRQSGYLRGARL